MKVTAFNSDGTVAWTTDPQSPGAPTVADDYTPSMEEIRRALGLAGTKWQRGAFDRAIATHDAELRKEIAAEILSHQGEIAAGTWYSAITYAARIAEGEK